MATTKRDTPLSALAVQIVQAALRPEVSVAELAALARTDPGFAMRLLSVVNSAAYALPHKVNDVAQAASLLGVNGLRNLALSLSLSQLVPMGPHGEVLLANSLRRGVAARLVAERTGARKQLDDYFTAGLFLEAGLLARASEDLEGAAEVARSPALARPVQERASGELPHPARGAALTRDWQLSEEVVDAIACHHDVRPPDPPLGRACWLAERLAAVFEGGDAEQARAQAAKAAGLVSLPASALDDLLAAIPAQVKSAACGFQREVGEQPDLDALMRNANQQLVELNRNYEQMLRRLERLLGEKDELNQKLESANKRLAHIASVDGLTGLFNHRTFQEALKRDLNRATRARTPLSVVLLDVDHFKKFNDTWGHPAGDVVLKAMGKLLLASIRAGDVAARYGGEEFVLILPDTNLGGATTLAERLRGNVEKLRINVGSDTLNVTASFGVACSHEDLRLDQPQLIVRADAALYAAKGAGRNCVKQAT